MKELEKGFVTHLAAAWEGGFNHDYRITRSYRWNQWRKQSGYRDDGRWFCSSLAEADLRYSWTQSQGKRTFEQLSDNLMAAIKADNEPLVRSICLEIFTWGGVGANNMNRSRIWVEDQTKGTLVGRLKQAVAALQDRNADLEGFDGKSALMNSAMTKVYAACCPDQLVIYDGRVGAALGLIVRDFLSEAGHPGPVPAELAFAWGAARTPGVNRNPSKGPFVFPPLFRSAADQKHALLMREVSYLLCETVKQINKPEVTLNRLERALFMIGYHVSRIA